MKSDKQDDRVKEGKKETQPAAETPDRAESPVFDIKEAKERLFIKLCDVLYGNEEPKELTEDEKKTLERLQQIYGHLLRSKGYTD